MARFKVRERIERRKEVARLYLQGWQQIQIAEKFGISQGQVSNDLKVVYKLWKKEAVRDFDELKERELIKIDNLEQEYWKAYNNSDRDPRYLSGVQWCVEKRAKIFGIDAPTDTNLNITDVNAARNKLIKALSEGEKQG